MSTFTTPDDPPSTGNTDRLQRARDRAFRRRAAALDNLAKAEQSPTAGTSWGKQRIRQCAKAVRTATEAFAVFERAERETAIERARGGQACLPSRPDRRL